MLHPSTLFRLTVLAGVACLAHAIVREAAAERADVRRLPSPDRRGASPSRTAGRKRRNPPRGRRRVEAASDE